MRKIIISILVCLLLIATPFFMVNGFEALDIKGFMGLGEKNKEIEKKISELTNVINVTYESTYSGLKNSTNKLIDDKTKYENEAELSRSGESSYASQLEAYDIDYLWAKLGNFAKDENVVIKIEVKSSGVSKNLYDLYFTVTGDYVDITTFIYDIENDSKLGFKIDDFYMSSTTTLDASTTNIVYDDLKATFTCTEIPIDIEKLDASSQNTTSSNTTNTTNTASSSSTGTNTTNSVESNTTDSSSSADSNTSSNSTTSNTSSANEN